MKFSRLALLSLSLCLFAGFGVFAEDTKVEQGKAAVVFSKMRSKQRTVTTAPAVVQVEKKQEVKKTDAVKSATDACVNGACNAVQQATTTTYQYRRSTPFRSQPRSIFRSRTRTSGSCASCGT